MQLKGIFTQALNLKYDAKKICQANLIHTPTIWSDNMFKTFISKQGFENFKTDETLSAAAKQSLLNTGWRWSRYNQCWFPATKNAQEKAKEFIKDFQTVFLPETVSTVDNVTVHSNNEKAQEPPSISKADFIQEYLEKVNILSPNFSTDKFSVIAETLKNDSIMYLDNKTLGTVEFPSGTLGDLRKEKTGGYGMKHIIQGRYEKDGMNNTDIASLLYAITNVVEVAEVQDTSKDRINIVKNGIVVGLSRNWYGENKTWVITGFAENDKNNEMTQVAKDTIRTVNAQCGYALEHSHIRDQVGAITTFIDSVRQANKKSNEQKNENTNDNLKYLTPKNIASLTDWQKRISTITPNHQLTNEEHVNETPATQSKKQIKNIRISQIKNIPELTEPIGLKVYADWDDWQTTLTQTRQSIKIKDIRNQAKEILKKPDTEITEADKLILSQYEGAGGINEKDKTTEGVLNEFYTPQNVIDKVWHVVDTIVPNVKTVLEPSSGIGKFARGRNEKFTMYEIDETSSRIARLLNPHATVINEPYQKQFFNSDGRVLNKNFEQKQYDLVIGNPPYGAYTGKWKGLGEGKEFSRYEEYFISKSLDALHGGTNGNEVDNGMLAFVVPSSFLNSPSDKQKEIIAQKGTLVEAFRLPSGTFNTTDVGTDIIFIAKMQYDLNNATDKQLIVENIHKISNNNFFTEHPEHILGEIKTRTNRFGKEEAYVAVHKGLTVQDELNKIDEFYKVQQNETTKTIEPHLFSQKENVSHEKQLPENSVTVHSNANAVSHEPTTLHKNEVRESKFHAPAPHETKQYLMSNEEFARLYEKQFDENEFNLTVSTKWNGEIDSNNFTDAKKEYIRSSKNYIEVKPDVFMHKEIFLSGNIYEKIKEQTTLLQNANDKNARTLFEKNITLLEKIKPAPLALETIHIPIKSPLAENFLITHTNENGETVDLNLQESFILWAKNETIGDKYSRVAINYASANISREDLPSNISWADIVSYIDGNPVRADRVRSYYGRTDDEIANEKIIQKKLADEKRQNRSDIANVLFDKFIHAGLDSETQKKLQTQYNELFNSYVAPQYEKLPLFIDGMNAYKGKDAFKLYEQQIKGISFLCNKGNGLLAYDVGVGKTAAGIVATVNQLQSLRATKPIIVVPNQVYKKWFNDIHELFPTITINDLYNLNKEKIAHLRDDFMRYSDTDVASHNYQVNVRFLLRKRYLQNTRKYFVNNLACYV